MIAFATIFLGLILGDQEVEVVVGDEVAAVEIVLNGQPAGRLEAPPWKLVCDLGPELAPQELIAVALDADGRELGRARQWINLPQPPAHVTVALDGGGDQPRVARLLWESRAGEQPRTFQISLDGKALEVDDPSRVVLPPHDDRQLHFLRVELEFSDHVATVAEVTFGGTYADQVSTELTAIPVLARGGKLRRDGALDGLLLKRGEPLRVVAVERGTAQIVVVPDAGVLAALGELARFRYTNQLPLGERAQRLRAWARFGSKQFVRFLWPTVELQQGRRQQFYLFPMSQEYDDDTGFFLMLYHAFQTPRLGEQRLADAVAVAGLHAAEQRQRRTVVLLLGGPAAEDASQLTPDQARRYLERLRVPFYVWSLAGSDGGDWGEAADVSSMVKLDRTVERVSQKLHRQRLVWVDGIHLPQEVALAPGAKGIELVP